MTQTAILPCFALRRFISSQLFSLLRGAQLSSPIVKATSVYLVSFNCQHKSPEQIRYLKIPKLSLTRNVYIIILDRDYGLRCSWYTIEADFRNGSGHLPHQLLYILSHPYYTKTSINRAAKSINPMTYVFLRSWILYKWSEHHSKWLFRRHTYF